MPRILLTGFEPYGGYLENSSLEVLRGVAAQGAGGVELIVQQMPVCFSGVASALRAAVQEHSPDIIIMLGQSGGSGCVRLERVALNMMDAKIPDNDGYIPNEETVYAGAPPDRKSVV